MRILIVDDHALMRSGLQRILASEFSDLAVGEASDSQQAIAMALQHQWDLVILDILLPGRNGLEFLKEIKDRRPDLPVLVLSMYPEHQYATRALRAGAAGYVTKATVPAELVKAVKKVLEGGKYVSASLAERLASELSAPTDRPLHETLSDREYEVLCLLASGKILKEVADELSLSINTVSTYRARILEKMKMNTNAELTRYAIENKLVQ